jgi:tetratricopeptide (TPR) repeat protein
MRLQGNFEAEMSDALLWNELGKIYERIGSGEDAIVAYTKAIELNPDSGWSYCNLGHAYFLKGEFGRALFLFRKSIQFMDTPENQGEVWNKIGDAYRGMKDIDNAIQAYKKADDLFMGASLAKQIKPKQPGTLSNLHESPMAEKNLAEGLGKPIVLPTMAIPKDPSVENQAREDGFQPVAGGNGLAESKPSADQSDVKNIEPPAPLVSTTKELVAPKAGDHRTPSQPGNVPDNTLVSKEKTLIVIPDPRGTPGNLLNGERHPGKPDQTGNSEMAKGQEEIQTGRPMNPSSVASSIDNLEEILAKVNIYEKITRVNPTNDRAWDTLGKLYKSLGRFEDAVSAYQKAIEITPDREVYYYYLGLLFSVEQQHENAVRAFQIVLQKNPDYILAHSALAGVYHRMGLENKANHHIATALPKMNNESAYNRACFYAICGEKELAFEFLRLALKNKDTTIDWIKSDPDLDPIRSDQRYLVLISEKNQQAPENNNENFFSSELEGKRNRLLPILNHSLAR